jgi:formylglycine-generating enzyme required for sulfatase activity
MKTTNLLTLCVFLATFLFGGMALANDSAVFESVTSDSTLETPKLTVTIEGNQVTLSWSKVTGATVYQVHYAQYPYDNPDTIKTIDVGNHTSASYDLSPGCAYHVAVKACSIPSRGFSVDCGDYSNIHDVTIPLVSTFKNSLGQEFKLIPAGTFTMGSPADEPGRNDWFMENMETQHSVTLTKPFYMQTTEVTQAQWEEVMGSNPSEHSGCPTCPVERVSWDDVQSYITKVNVTGEGVYSLPTEAQWEYAARAGSTTAFYNGGITELKCVIWNPCHNKEGPGDPNLGAIGWFCDNSVPVSQCSGSYTPPTESHPVGKKSPNTWGLYDMSGNVTEWCQDWFWPYTSSPVTDPTGPSSGHQLPMRVTRSGCFVTDPAGCRSANRWMEFTNVRNGGLGFRLVRQP